MAFHRPALVLCCVAFTVTSNVHAVGFGRVAPTAVLGQPLNVLVPIHLDQGERMFAECVRADVMMGDVTLLANQVRVAVQATADPAEWVARISTLGAIDEPVVEISVSAGCEKRFMRRFTAFADPPTAGSLSAAASLMAPPVYGSLQAVTGAPATFNESRQARRSGLRRSARPDVDSPPAPKQVLAKAKTREAAPAVPRESQVARLLLDVGSGPRLRMDIEDPVFMPAGALAGGASAVLADSGNPEADRLLLLEKTLADLKRETQAARSSETGLKTRLVEAESRGRMLPWLLALLLLASGVAGWLAWRLRQQRPATEKSDGQPSWWGGEAAAGAEGEPLSVAGELVDTPAPVNRAAAPVVIDPFETDADTAPISAHQKTVAFAGPVPASPYASVIDGSVPAREVSVEELLDLEQQADFFIALGQEDAAVDLLMSHLRSSGGQSPLPYTKLLEIYRRQGDRSAYERIRARFNRRFNAYAPDWDVGPLHGRNLEDYPEVVLRLQALWVSPLNAMAVLEAMLFRNDERQELFDLPAYKDVLLLYSLARDLYQQEGLSAADVDLLLPLGDEGGIALAPVAPRGETYELTSFSLDSVSAPSPDGAQLDIAPRH